MPDGADVLFVLDPLPVLDPRADSSYVMISEALRRGHRPHAVMLEGLSAQGADGMANAVPVTIDEPGAPVRASGPAARRPLSDFRVVLMRKDPPFDQGYLAATWLLDLAPPETVVVNTPSGLRDINEKLSILRFGDLIPKTFISRDAEELRSILETLGGQMIVKPVYGFGGREILLARQDDPNLGSILELATAEGTRWTVAQAFIERASEGDKRILMVDGEPIGAVLRVPRAGELRNNFHAGGSPALSPLDGADRRICERVGPFLRENGQFFAGLDVIGGLLTEINVTSPTGMQEINRLEKLVGEQTMQARFWQALETKLTT